MWVGGLWVVGHVCLKIKKFIYSLPQCSVQIWLRACLFREFPVVDKKRVRVRVRDPRPTHPRRLDTLTGPRGSSYREFALSGVRS